MKSWFDRNQHFVQETPEAATQFVFVPVTLVSGSVDLHVHRLPGRVVRIVHLVPHHALRVEQSASVQTAAECSVQSVRNPQLHVVQHRLSHAAGLRYHAKVFHFQVPAIFDFIGCFVTERRRLGWWPEFGGPSH